MSEIGLKQNERTTPEVHDAIGLERYKNDIGQYEVLKAEEESELAQYIEAGLSARAVLDGEVEVSDAIKEMYPTEEDMHHDLEQVALEGNAAKQQFILHNLRLAFNQANRFASDNTLPLDDKIQAANMGLIRAVEGFDYEKGNKFSTYAVPHIKKALQQLMYGNRAVRVPEEWLLIDGMHDRARENLLQELGREPTDEEITAQIRKKKVGKAVTPKRMQELKLELRRTVSLEEPIFKGAKSTYDDVLAEETEDEEIPVSELYSFDDALVKLDEIERQVVRYSYGFENDGQSYSHAEIAELLNLKLWKVREIKGHALKKLRSTIKMRPEV